MRSREERERDGQYFGDVTFGLGLCLWCRERPATHDGECEICWRLPGHQGEAVNTALVVLKEALDYTQESDFSVRILQRILLRGLKTLAEGQDE